MALLIGTASLRANDESKSKSPRRKVAPHADKGHLIPTRDGRNSQDAPGRIVGGANGPEYRVRTGSMIPERYYRRGYTTDSRDNLYIYDQNDIRLQSRDTVSESLRSVPGISIRGTR